MLFPKVKYKKGHDERKAKYTSLAEPPEVELAKKNFANRSNVSTQAHTNQVKVVFGRFKSWSNFLFFYNSF